MKGNITVGLSDEQVNMIVKSMKSRLLYEDGISSEDKQVMIDVVWALGRGDEI